MNYENLTDPRNGGDQKSCQVAEAMMQLASIRLATPPVDDEEAAFALAEEAEDMARKSCSIAIRKDTVNRYAVFGYVLLKRGKYTDETRMVLEQTLSLQRQYSSRNTSLKSMCLQRLVDMCVVLHTSANISTVHTQIKKAGSSLPSSDTQSIRLWVKKQMADLCCMVGCNSLGTKSCGACGVVSYCSVECQKGDWKVHKHSCVNMTKLPTTFLTMSEILKYGTKIGAQVNILQSQGKVKEAITLQQRCLAFAEHQFGVQVEGTSYWRRSNGDSVNNIMLIHIRMQIADTCIHICDYDSALAHAIKARQMLEHRDRSNDTTLDLLAKIENAIFAIYFAKMQLEKAEYHCQQSLTFARLIKGEGRIDNEFGALMTFVCILQGQWRYLEAIEVSEQAYVLVSGAYGPVHPGVQHAATLLIDCLITNGDFSRADDSCRMNLETLTDTGIDHNDGQVPFGMKQIADIWLMKPPEGDEKSADRSGLCYEVQYSYNKHNKQEDK